MKLCNGGYGKKELYLVLLVLPDELNILQVS